MSSKTVIGLALDQMAEIQQHINALEKWAKSNALTPGQKQSYKMRMELYNKLALGAAEIYKLAKAEFLMREEKEKDLKYQNIIRATRLALPFDKWKVLKDHDLLYLVK